MPEFLTLMGAGALMAWGLGFVGYFLLRGLALGLARIMKTSTDQGLKALNDQQYLKAAAFFEKALKARETEARYLLKSLAQVYTQMGDLPKALKYLQRTLEADPGDLEAQFQQSKILDQLGDMAGAEGIIDGIRERYPLDLRAVYQKSQFLMRQGSWAEAVKALLQVQQTYALDYSLNLDLCICYLHLDEVDFARASLETAVKNGFQDPEAFWNRFRFGESLPGSSAD